MATDIAVVKKLEWESRSWTRAEKRWRASSVAGDYFAGEQFGGGVWRRSTEAPDHTENLEAAKAAAQADYEQRILSALSQDYLDLKASHDAAVAALRDAAQSAGFQYMLAETRDRIDAALAKAAALTTPAAPAAAADGWIAWEGGECPVDGDTRVTVRLRNGDEHTSRARYYTMAIDWWRHEADNRGCDIVAYRPAAGGAL